MLAYFALGANLGDRLASLQAAFRGLSSLGHQPRASSVYLSQAWPNPAEPSYLNAVVSLHCELEPLALLDTVLELEHALGRRRGPQRFAPRLIDIDILLCDALCIQAPRLELPHPRMTERAFVLRPLNELASDLLHPRLKVSFAELLAACTNHAELAYPSTVFSP